MAGVLKTNGSELKKAAWDYLRYSVENNSHSKPLMNRLQ